MEFALELSTSQFQPQPSTPSPIRGESILQSYPTIAARYISASFITKPQELHRQQRSDSPPSTSSVTSTVFSPVDGDWQMIRSAAATPSTTLVNDSSGMCPVFVFALKVPTVIAASSSTTTTTVGTTIYQPVSSVQHQSGVREGGRNLAVPLCDVAALHDVGDYWRVLFMAVVLSSETPSSESVQQVVQRYQSCHTVRLVETSPPPPPPPLSGTTKDIKRYGEDLLDRLLNASSPAAAVSERLLKLSGATVDDFFPLTAFDSKESAACDTPRSEDTIDTQTTIGRVTTAIGDRTKEASRLSERRVSAVQRVMGAFAPRLTLAREVSFHDGVLTVQ